MKFQCTFEEGSPKPLGATITDGGVNFSLFSKNATKVTLCLLEETSKAVIQEIPFDPEVNKTGNIWHIFVKGLQLPLLYGYRLDGPRQKPYLYSPKNLVSDPYAISIKSSRVWNDTHEEYFPYSYLEKTSPFDWQGIRHPRLSSRELIIYEMHVRGFTQDPSSGVKEPGTFLGLIEKIPYLLDLGVNVIELMPINEFNEREYGKKDPESQKNLFNYWGYSTVNFFSPMNRFASKDGKESTINEFKTMVRELHRNGIEVILDIVFNHTAEKGMDSPPYSFRGIDSMVYRLLDHNGIDQNYSGCGHTMRLNHPVMRQFVRDCLYYWFTEMQVDGFRFDLASIMNRNINGKLLNISPLIESLSNDPILANAKLIAEPWDCTGAYQLGKFSTTGAKWKEWNGKYRDEVRGFIKNDDHSKNLVAARISGSEDYFYKTSPLSSINFITAHDGFTLADLVSYNEKHNLANGENNRDGNDYNLSWNCGSEGSTEDRTVLSLRERQMKNSMTILLVSQGVPMICMGDECAHTRQGNNNPWCQDNELNWFPWQRLENEKGLFRFIKELIRFRRKHLDIFNGQFLRRETIQWHGEQPNNPKWDDPASFLAFTLLDIKEHKHLYVVLNETDREIKVSLPKTQSKRKWYRIIDTYLNSPDDIIDDEQTPPLIEKEYLIQCHSCIILKAL